MLFGLKDHGGSAVAVEQCRDDAAVEVAQSVVVLRGRLEGRDDHAVFGVAAQLQTFGVHRSAPEAHQLRVQPLLDAQRLFGALCRSHAAVRRTAWRDRLRLPTLT